MVRQFFICAIIWILVVADAASGAAQETRGQQVLQAFDQLQSSAAAAEESGNLSEIDKLVVARLRAQIADLRNVYSVAPDTVWEGYPKVLAYEADLLRRATTPANAADSSKIVNSVASDIAAKRSFVLAVPAFGGPPPSSIKVTVVTTRDGQEESGFLVRCNPLLFADAQPMFIFNNPSSPTDAELAPGAYVFIAMKNGAVAARQQATIGLQGDPKAKVEVQVTAK